MNKTQFFLQMKKMFITKQVLRYSENNFLAKLTFKELLTLINPQETADLVTFTEEILNGKPHVLCSVKH